MLVNDSYPNHLTFDFGHVKQDFWTEISRKRGSDNEKEKGVSSLVFGKVEKAWVGWVK